MFVFDLIQTNRVNLQPSNRANSDNFFLAFLHRDETYNSKFRLLFLHLVILLPTFPDFRLADPCQIFSCFCSEIK